MYLKINQDIFKARLVNQRKKIFFKYFILYFILIVKIFNFFL